MMKLLSVNTGKARAFDNEMGRTGIFKTARPGPVAIHALGVGDDEICDLKHHGGPDQAVYIYGKPDYAFWETELCRRLEPGLFGENLTVSGFESRKIMIGDQLRIGAVVLEITSPRIPCSTFAKVIGEDNWVKRFHEAQRPGAYARVIAAGNVSAGDDVELIPFSGNRIPVTEMTSDYKKPAPERMRHLLKAPIHKDLRADYEAALKVLQQQQVQQQ